MKRFLGFAAVFCLFCSLCSAAATVGKLAPGFKLYVNGEISREDAAALAKDPAHAMAVAPRTVSADDNGLVEIVANGGEFKLQTQNPAILTATLTAEEDGEVYLGVGANWTFECYVNEQMVYSTLWDGNRTREFAADNHIFPVRVHKGVNHIAIYLLSGWQGGGWCVALDSFEPTPELQERFQPEVTHQPWITHAGIGTVTVNFPTANPIVAFVDYREKGTQEWQRAYELLGGQARDDRAEHTIPLNGLKDDTVYEYRPVLVPQPFTGRECPGPVHTFRTFSPAKKNFKVFFTSDTQMPPDRRVALLEDFLKNCGAATADLFVHGGDVDNIFDVSEPLFLDSFVDVLTADREMSQPLVALRGNHEYRGDRSGDYFGYFGGPDHRSYYAFRHGNTCFIVLDSGEDKPRWATMRWYARTYDAPLMAEQRAWLEKVVGSELFQEATFRVVLAHSPGYGESYMAKSIETIADGILTGDAPAHRIHLWLCGHTHRYSRSTGNGNSQRVFDRGAVLPYPETLPYVVLVNDGPGGGAGPDFSAVLLEFNDDRIEIRSMERDGKVFDHFSIRPDGSVTEHETSLQLAVPGKDAD
ncbi:metallophosphoesterase [Victivallis sp. Marseille-Q1083]|uniref:metallophosphoesterase family protein n=1 Tax=Victivallis sp. Marseille-Q1083 TaxID=2717288 RepID=UPI00158CBDF5|nr:metallophosphoesterase [Victivallis sp. Marseille-Q1083]